MTQNILVLAFVSLPLLIGGCVGGPDDTSRNPDDTGSDIDWTATIEIAIPEDVPEDTKVTAGTKDGGWTEVLECADRVCTFKALEPDLYTISAVAEGLYFATLTQEVNTDGQTVSTAWQKGGCTDPEWQVGDGQCPSWEDGQYGCDLTGYWKGVEDEVADNRGDIVMTTTDLDGDGTVEASVDGGYDSDDLVRFVGAPLNMSGGTMNRMIDDVTAWLTADTESCDDTIIRVIDQFGEFHMERVE